MRHDHTAGPFPSRPAHVPRARWLLVPLLASALLTVAAIPSDANVAGSGNRKWAVVLCNFKDQRATPNPASYYRDLFSDDGAGELGLLEYWRDVSYGQLSISGTTVTPAWNIAKDPAGAHPQLTRGQWINLPGSPGQRRLNKILACAEGSGVNFAGYWGVAAVFPEARSTLQAAMNATQTTATLSTLTNFPDGSAPFAMSIGAETVTVTAINGNTLTVTRGANAQAHAVQTRADVPGDLGGVGTGQNNGLSIGGGVYNLATIVLPHQIDVEGAAHETGHGFGYEDSRAFSTSSRGYNDQTDIMSAYDAESFSPNPGSANYRQGSGTDFGGTGLYNTVLGEPQGSKGPGLNVVNLDKQGWIPAARKASFSGGQFTATLHALGDPFALNAPAGQLLMARLPAAVTIQNASPNDALPTIPPTCAGAGFGCTTSPHYTLEFRENSGWDRGITQSAVIVHMPGADGRSYLVDRTPAGAAVGQRGRLVAGGVFVDPARSIYAAVNTIDPASHTAAVTISNARITTAVSLPGATDGDFSDPVTLAADLRVAPSGLPVPGRQVRLSVGTQSCPAITNAAGRAACTVTLDQHPGVVPLGATFTGDDAHGASNATRNFTITPEDSKLTYSGATSGDYHDPATVSATLTDRDDGTPIAAKPITFTLGVGDTCTATTGPAGVATCTLTPNQVPGPYSIVAGFGPDVDYVSSSVSTPFTITKEQTTLAYDGPARVANDFPTTLSGTLVEDDGAAVPGRTVRFTLGSGPTAQSCNATTDPGGHAACPIPSVMQPANATSVAVRADFAGDAYYLASTTSATLKLVYYTGRAYALSQKVALLGPSFTSDTGSISTSARSNTTRSVATAGAPPAGSVLGTLLNPLLGTLLTSPGSPVSVSALNASVRTGAGRSHAQASAGDVIVGVPFLPVIRAGAVQASSSSTCDVRTFTSRATGGSTIGTLTIGGVTQVTSGLGPNAVIRVGPATIVVNEQLPVPGASSGLQVNALHVTVPGVLDVVVASARSGVHNCP